MPLRFEAGGYRNLGYVDDFEALLRAIDAAVPKDATLRVEGGGEWMRPEVKEFLRARPSRAQVITWQPDTTTSAPA